ncbi:uncharacterized protein LOC106672413 isoform X2 [Cimex lectularius]|uniref:Uncharacterized protein n=1 Tax=Cimex lectularius TaxID=79782 RepID=A0A8I6TKN4_CIMLE|nr:uncharacterized protein LOC106672413 isoform X2 [Cimex lectularius]
MHLKIPQMCYADKKSEAKRRVNALNWNYLLTALNAKHSQSKAKQITWDLTELKNSLVTDSNILTDQVIRNPPQGTQLR